jgi:hypothetical protein
MVAAVVDPPLVSGQGIDVSRNGVKALWKTANQGGSNMRNVRRRTAALGVVALTLNQR